ncbi:MAG: PorV/PorQ family protein [Candidatus Goldiibacteriota bacterium]
MFRGVFFTVFFFAAVSVFAGPWGMPMETLHRDIGVRALGMGGAYTADSRDASAYYWNASFLDELTANIFFTSFETLMEGANAEVLSFAAPLGKNGGIGAGVEIINFGDYEQVNELGDVEGTESNRDITAAVSYGRNLFSGIKGGMSIKTITRKMGAENYTGFNADVGLYRSFGGRFAAGLNIKNIIPTGIMYSESEEDFVSSARLGLSFKTAEGKLKLNADVEKYFIDVIPVVCVGAEYRVLDMLYIRTGLNAAADRNNLSGGIGVEYAGFVFDYAVVAAEEMISHKAALSYVFGGYELAVKPEPEVFSPVGGNKKTYLRIKADTKYEIFKWKLEIKNSEGDVVKSWEGAGAPDDAYTWDGLTRDGLPEKDGIYKAVLTVTDENDTILKSEKSEIKISTMRERLNPLFD